MATFFKKRKKASGPNKNQLKVMRAQQAEDAESRSETIGGRFPTVRAIRLKLKLVDPRGNVLDEKETTLGPSNRTEFSHECSGRCGRGVFEFGKDVANLVAGRTPISETSTPCAETLYAGSAETCGYVLQRRIEIDFAPAPAA